MSMKAIWIGRLLGLLALLAVGGQPTLAQTPDGTYTLAIKDHKFEPTEITVPAGKPIKLIVKNLDATPEEFESKVLKVEKVIQGGKEGVVNLRALQPGTYEFIGEYHAATAKGRIIAK